jgi:tRNA modification GTPase
MGGTIFALSSGVGRAAIAVVRLSGPATRACLASLAGGVPTPRMATLRALRDARSGEMLDEALVLFFPGPRSYTGEDMAELHVHGGRAVVSGVLDALSAMEGCRPAGPGDFTRRALAHGRLDLTRVEGIADLVDAETALQRRQALGQAGGALARAAQGWRDAFLDAMAQVEAEIDFSDEGDVVSHGRLDDLTLRLEQLQLALKAALADGDKGERLREGALVVIAGPPNAGKSTLLNRLAQRDVAIVSPIPGTTRDTLEVHLDLQGVPVVVVDTAGLREATDDIEAIGMARARRRAEEADLVLWLSPAGNPVPVEQGLAHAVPVTTKIDSDPNGTASAFGLDAEIRISALTGDGMDALMALIHDRAVTRVVAESPLLTRTRHRLALREASKALDRALAGRHDGALPELIAEDLRLGARAMASLLGAVDVEDVLDRVFAAFCIGK